MPAWLLELLRPGEGAGTGSAGSRLRLPRLLASAAVNRLAVALVSNTSGVPWLLEPLAVAATLVGGKPYPYSPELQPS